MQQCRINNILQKQIIIVYTYNLATDCVIFMFIDEI